MKLKDFCESERPRERLLSSGASGLSNGELLAILLRNGDKERNAVELGQQLLKMVDGRLGTLFNMSSAKMCSLPGIGPAKAAVVMAAFELGKRFLNEESGIDKKPIVSSRTVYEIMIPVLKGKQHEECWLLLLNDNNYLLSKMMLSSGGGRSTVIDVRHIIRHSIEHNASGLILVHNHPSGNPRPSEADLKQTEALHKAASSVGIDLLDHVVFCDDQFFSFSDKHVFHY